MAEKVFGVNINLDLNQLVSAIIENVIVDPTPSGATKGRFVFNTISGRLLYDDGVAIQQVANLNDVAGLLDFKGGYNATTNTPNLVSPAPGVVKKGDYYVVTTGGTFFTATLEVGDSMFANIDDPTVLADWTIMQANVAYATETVAGIIQIATQAEVDAGTNDTKAITPLKLKNKPLQNRTLFSQTASVTVAAAASAGASGAISGAGVGTLVLPANFFSAGKVIRLRVLGIITKTGTKSFTVTVNLNGVAFITGAYTSGQLASPTNGTFSMDVVITCRTTGGGGTTFTQGDLTTIDGGGGSAQKVPGSTQFSRTATNAIDTTIAQTVSANVVWGAEGGTGSITCTNLVMTEQ